MRKITRQITRDFFYCEHCDTEYDHEIQAKHCEQEHVSQDCAHVFEVSRMSVYFNRDDKDEGRFWVEEKCRICNTTKMDIDLVGDVATECIDPLVSKLKVREFLNKAKGA